MIDLFNKDLSPGAGDEVQGSQKPTANRELDKILALLAKQGLQLPSLCCASQKGFSWS